MPHAHSHSAEPARSRAADSARLLVLVPARFDGLPERDARERWRSLLCGSPGEAELVFADAADDGWRSAGDLDFDAVLLDWTGPGGDAADPMVRAREVARFAPILAVTPGPHHPRTQIARRLGAKEVLGRNELEAPPLAMRVRNLIESERMLGALRASRDRARRSATRDSATGLIDRATLLEQLDRTLAANERAQRSTALLLFDLDDFGAIDRRLGRPASDELLRRLAERLRQITRRGDVAARVGGDEFAVVLASPRDATAPARAVEKILDLLAEPLSIHGCDLRIEASAGIALAPADGVRSDELLRSAEHALLDAKQGARGGHRHANAELGDDVQRAIANERSLRRAIAAEAPPLRLEAQLDVLGGQVSALHSLLDWQPRHAQRSDGSGAVLARRSAEIESLAFGWHLRGAYALAGRIADAAHARVEKRGGGGVSTLVIDVARRPLSAGEFSAFARAAQATGVRAGADQPRGSIAFEAEFALAADAPHATVNAALTLAAARQLRELRIGLALRVDGMSSAALDQLRDLPLASLVIDRRRVARAPDDALERNLLAALVAIGRERGLRVVAEGVDSVEQRDLLLEFGCAEMRGSLFAKPLPEAQLEEFLREH